MTTPLIAALDPGFLFASMFWSSVGVGYFIYGKKQHSLSAMLGGILLIILSCAIHSPWLMSLLALGVMAVVFHLARKGE